jgi:hypothetical protein
MPTIPRPFTRTVREFVFQIATIIAGILIALPVDSRSCAIHMALHELGGDSSGTNT